MKKPVIIRKEDVERRPIPFAGKDGDAGWWRRVICPENVDTKGISMGVLEINPGFAAHAWHNHNYDKKVNQRLGIEVEVKYPKKDNEYIFEEFYCIMSGSGSMQWETESGKTEEIGVNAGDIIFFPRGVAKHQLLNNGDKKMYIIYGGSPLTEANIKHLNELAASNEGQ